MLHRRIRLSLLFVLSAFTIDCPAAEKPPTADDVNTLTTLTGLAINNFYRETFEIRMRHEFADGFFQKDDRGHLYSSAQKSAQHLADIIVQLEDVIRQIEQYQGADWNQRFGDTGLYEKTSGQLFGAKTSKFGIDYYAVLAAAGNDAKELLQQIDSFTETQNSFYVQLVKGKTLALLAKTDPNYAPKIARLFSELRKRSDASQRLAFLASIEQVKSESARKDIEADRLARDLVKTNLTDDLEVLLPLAFLQRRLGMVDNYNELLQSNPHARAVTADITLAWLEAGHAPANPLDGALAAEAALRNDPLMHKELLSKLAQDNTSASPVVDYAAAVAVADSNEPQAVYLLIGASRLLDEQAAEILKLTDKQIAAHAAKLAYRAFVKEPNQCELAADAFETYFDLAGKSADPNLQYTYTQVLTLCGQYQQAVDMLRKIPPAAEHLYPKAQLDLLSAQIVSGLSASIFDRAEYAAAFAHYLRDPGDCVYLEPATALLHSYLKEIELLETDQTVYLNTVKDSKKSAEFLYDCIQDRTRASILAEFTALDPNTSAEELTAADELLTAVGQTNSNADMLRAAARLAERRRDFAQAARLWERVAQLNETTDQNPRSWQWWRAKYYQLQSAAKGADNRCEITHAIDVLRATYKDIPEPWAAKLELLARDLGR